jgi:hypothetical protein
MSSENQPQGEAELQSAQKWNRSATRPIEVGSAAAFSSDSSSLGKSATRIPSRSISPLKLLFCGEEKQASH